MESKHLSCVEKRHIVRNIARGGWLPSHDIPTMVYGPLSASFLEGWAPNSAASQQAEKHPIPPRGKGRHNPVPRCVRYALPCAV
jgi:hypothetical protein